MWNNFKRGFPQSHARCLAVRAMGKSSGLSTTGSSTGTDVSTGGTPEEEEDVPLPFPFALLFPFPLPLPLPLSPLLPFPEGPWKPT